MSRWSNVEEKSMLDRLTKLRLDQHREKYGDDDNGELDLVTLIHNTCGDGVYDPSKKFGSLEGYHYARSRGRRKSREFEDLLMHTATGNLHPFGQGHKASGFLRPKTSNIRHQSSASHHTSKSTVAKSTYSPKSHRPVQRSHSDVGDMVTSFKPHKPHSVSRTGSSAQEEKAQSPTVRRKQRNKQH